MKYRIALLEDEQSEKEITLLMLNRFFKENDLEFEVVTFDKGDDFLSLNFSTLDLLLLDIILPGDKNGLDVAKEIRKKAENVAVIFITKTAQFAVDSYDVDAIDYILKPLSYFDFSLKLKKALKHIDSQQTKELSFKIKDGLVRLKEKEILYFEINKHYLHIHTLDNVFITRETMKDIASSVSSSFAKSGNSFLINLRHVTKVRRQEVELGDISIPLTKNYRDSFLQALGAYAGRSS